MSYPFVWFDNPHVLAEQYPPETPIPEVLLSSFDPSTSHKLHEQKSFKQMIFQQHKSAILHRINSNSITVDVASSSSSLEMKSEEKLGHPNNNNNNNNSNSSNNSNNSKIVEMNDVPHSAIPHPDRIARPWHDMYKLHGLRLPERARGWRFNWPIWRQHHIIPELSSHRRRWVSHVSEKPEIISLQTAKPFLIEDDANT
jgi:hypothetical protein